MTDQPLNQKDADWEAILSHFRNMEYETSFVKSIKYFTDDLPKKEFYPTTKDKITVVYTIVCSAFGIQNKSEAFLKKEWEFFFQYLDTYVSLCKSGAKKERLKGLFTSQPKTLLGDCLELLCRFESIRLKQDAQKWVLRFAEIDAPGWGYDLALSVLREKIFNERIEFERPDYVNNTRSLCEVYLKITKPLSDQYIAGRTHIMNVLSDLAYFQGGEKGEDEALMWVNRSLEINPEDQFAIIRKKFIEERQVVFQQIRRFNHDTSTAMAGIDNRLKWLLNRPDVKDSEVEMYLIRIKKELQRIQGIKRFIEGMDPRYKKFKPIEILNEIVLAYQEKATIHITPELCTVTWETDPDYLGIVINNLMTNALEAFERNKIPVTDRKINISVDPEAFIISIRDNAGGVDPKIKDKMFDPYVSSKGIKKETGLGLFNVRMVLEKLKGEIVFPENQPENGALFKIHLYL